MFVCFLCLKVSARVGFEVRGLDLSNPWYVYGVNLHLVLVGLRVKKYLGVKFVLQRCH